MDVATVEFWYEFASPYSYLAAARIERLAAGSLIGLVWRPFLLGPILAQRAHDPSPFQNPTPAQRRYRWRDVQRLCAAEALPLRHPSTYPRNGLLAARVALIAAAEGWGPAFTRAVYHANFAEDRDIAAQAVIADILAALGRDVAAVLERAKSAENKAKLKAQGEEAVRRGVFGAPSFLVGDELFWGNDRLDTALAWALAPRHLPPLA
ncbi:MAG TPA: 2-hydroxychromene-2-carboxylate isomerase [Stellaceae bacterium]|nr:2-hydroxychromene-2-carboxylate isomerase [Stellaceae bacterium]